MAHPIQQISSTRALDGPLKQSSLSIVNNNPGDEIFHVLEIFGYLK
jgi:hypothetical protein